jgi:hypothetical protein
LPAPVNLALGRLLRRAEDEDPERLVETFVDVGALFAQLSTRDNQIIFGRRGTGKTHALTYLAEQLRGNGSTVVSVDLRLLGSSGGIYADSSIPVSEAATRLLLDALERLHEDLVDQALEAAEDGGGTADQTLLLLDRLADAITEVSVVGDAEQRVQEGHEASTGNESSVEAGASSAGPLLRAAAESSQYRRIIREREILFRGVARHRVHFGAVGSILRKLVPTLPGKRLWLLLDEWSHVPIHLQPLLADLLRHCVLPVPGLTVKIAAIDHRSAFKIERQDYSYIGFEVGADVAADIDLDDFMVFSNDSDTAVVFFGQLFHRHVAAMASEYDGIPTYSSTDHFIQEAFASPEAFRELVRSGEGVPRDAINIVGKAALMADQRRISIELVRAAAHRWYLQDKEGAVKSRPDGLRLLHWIIDRVIGHRGVRAFLLRQGGESHLVDWLYDSRVLHLVKRGMAAKDRPGVRYDAYALDYGCYVDLLATRRAPQGLIVTDGDEYLQVPPDEYDDRIRGAILDLSAFEANESGTTASRGQLPPIEIVVRSTTISFIVIDEEFANVVDQIAESGWYLLTELYGRIAVIEVGRRTLRIGSATSSEIRVRNSDLLARHATLSKADPQLVISNAQSAPVYVNGRRSRNAPLVERDTVRIGEMEFVLVRKV